MRYARLASSAAIVVLFGCSGAPPDGAAGVNGAATTASGARVLPPVDLPTTPDVVQEDHHDTSRPLREMVQLPPEAVPEAPGREGPRHARPPHVGTGRPDPVLQTEDMGSLTGSFGVVNGTSSTGWTTPDANASVGSTQIVETVNASYQVFDKSSGRSLLGPSALTSLWTGFKGVCEYNPMGDPIVLYDKAAGRWMISHLAGYNGAFAECIAISTTADATGSFNRYAFTFAALNDYPKLGVWPDAYYASYNMMSSPNATQLCAYNRSAMLSGRRSSAVCFQRPPEDFFLLPSDLDGPTPPPAGAPNYFVGLPWGSSDHLNLFKFHVDFGTPANSTFTGPIPIAVAPFSAATDSIPQLGTTQQVDALQNVLMFRLPYRNFGDHESLVACHTVDAGTTTGIRWYELRDPGAASPTVYQQSTYAPPDSSYRWMPSIAMDGAGNIAVGYSVSSSTMYPAIRYTGRLASDPLGAMAAEASIIEGGGSEDVCGPSCEGRWGDYTSMAIDPTDDRTFVYTNEYYATTSPSNWSTRIAKLKLDPWSASGSMSSARYWHTATPLANGKVLVAGGYNASGALAGAEVYDSATGAFSATGSLITARYNQTATPLPNGKVVVVGGSSSGPGYVGSAELYDPSAGAFTATGSLLVPRNAHKATLLPNGKVLIAGGVGTSGYLASAELYEPSTGSFATTGSMTTSRYGHTTTLLPNGKVLVTGGRGALGYLASAELYDPATGSFAATGSMGAVRFWHTATLLPTGKVLVTGGYNPTTGYLASAELYDPATGTFTATGAMATPRNYHRDTLLPTGKVLVDGGYNGAAVVASAEQYDPATGTFSPARSMSSTREHHTATLLSTGKVLVAGGWDDGVAGAVATADLYDAGYPDNLGAFTSTASMGTARDWFTSTALPSGKVLIAGGNGASGASLGSAELYDPWARTFSPTGNMNATRSQHTATQLPSGKVLVSGGGSAAAELYDPWTGTFTFTGAMSSARAQHTATLLPSGKVLVAGGAYGSYFATAELYDPSTGTFTPTGSMATARFAHTATLLPNGKVLVAGGYGYAGALATAEVYDPATGTFTATGPLGTARENHTATPLPSGKVLIAGGDNASGRTASAELYDSSTGAFSATGSLVTARANHSATRLPNGKVLVAAGSNNLASAELYDPATGTFYATGSLVTARIIHTATLLPSNGNVLVAGGIQNTYPAVTFLSSAEIYQ